MSNSQHRPGPVPGDLVRVDTKITRQLDRALDDLVELSGVSKASLIRSALAQMLGAAGVMPPDAVNEIEPTPTRGPGLARQRRKKR